MTTWNLHGTSAQLRTPHLAAAIDVLRPQRGVQGIRFCAEPRQDRDDSDAAPISHASLMQVTLPGAADLETLSECWVRGNDLVAIYAPTSARPSQPEIYWRSISSAAAYGLELIVSVHTGVLDDDPRMEVATELATESVEWWSPRVDGTRPLKRGGVEVLAEEGPGVALLRLANDLTYLEMIFPSDFSRVELSWRDGIARVASSLFPERLEKGVIRRGRIRGWLFPAQVDGKIAKQLFADFEQSELPLTT